MPGKGKEVHIMKHTKKLTALLSAAAVLAASTAAFADNEAGGGGGSQTTFSVAITADAQKDGAFLIVPQEITVVSDKSDKYGFTDSTDGATVLDAVITMHEMKYGEAFTVETAADYLAISDSGWITKIFGEPGTTASFFVNSAMGTDTVDMAVISSGDTLEFAFFMDTDTYSDCYTSFMPDSVTGIAGEPIQLNMYKHEWPMYPTYELIPISGDDDLEALTINTVKEDGSLSEALKDSKDAPIVPDDKGVVTVSFNEPVTYIVTASGFIGEGEYPVIAPYCFVTVKPEPTSVKVTMDVQKDGAFLLAPQEIEVSSFTAEKYGFSDSFTGVTFLDALVAVHEMKYGEAFTAETVGDYLTSGVNPAYGTYYINTAFGEPASATAFYINSSMGYDTAEAAILSDGDTVEYCFYKDTTGWSDVYTTFDKKEVSVYVGDTITLTMSKMGYDDSWNPVMLPVDGTDKDNVITVNTVNADGSIGEAIEGAAPDASGNVTLSFDKPGICTVTAQGSVNGNSAIFAPYCIVTVKPVYELENIKISASATVKKSEGAEDAKIILAVYDKNGILTDSKIKAAENGEISFDVSIPNDSRVKMFIWDDENGMKPLTPIN